MKKFNTVYKEQQNRSNDLFESKILNEFESVYKTLLSKYKVTDYKVLNEEYKDTFLSELNTYWNDTTGLTDKGKTFMQTKSDVLSESSTVLQKKNYFNTKISTLVNESLRQADIKWKIYDVIDEIYRETGAKTLEHVMPRTELMSVINETLVNAFKTIYKEINTELKESSKINEKSNN